MESFVTRVEHEEFCRRIDDENDRQNKRIGSLESDMKRLEILNISIEKLAVNMENMLKEQLQQGKRLEILESRDGELWRKIASHIITVVIGVVLGYIFKQIGM